MDHASSTTPHRGRGRRPIADVRADVLAASAEVLLSEGVKGFTVEKVINTSGVSSATVFKHWPSRGALALDGYLHAVGDTVAVRDSGAIRSDIERMLVDFTVMAARRPDGEVFAQLIGTAQTDPDLADQFEHHYFGPRRREMLALLEAAKDRGDIPSRIAPDLLMDLLWGPCYMRLLLPHLADQLTPGFVREVVERVFAGFER